MSKASKGAPAEPRFQAQPRRKARPKGREGRISMTFWMSISTNADLHEIADKRGISLQGLVAEAVDGVLADHGKPPFKLDDNK